MRSNSLMGGAFSGTLLDGELLGGGASGAAFLGADAEGSGAACDPALFLVDDLEPAQAAAAQAPAAAQAAAQCAPAGTAPATAAPPRLTASSTARDLLAELESSLDALLPGQPLDALMLCADGDGWRASPPAPSPTTPAAWRASAFAAIPEEAELPPGVLAPAPAAYAPPPLSFFVPVPTPAPGAAEPGKLGLLASPVAALDVGCSASSSEAASPTASAAALHGRAGTARASYPRIASMPNMHLSLGEDDGAAPPAPASAAPAPSPRTRRSGAGRARAMPRSRSHSDLASGAAGTSGEAGELQRYNVPHLHFLTPPHLRKGKGGRQPAIDPRLDPSIDPKRARRIMANRLSAAKSKLKQKCSAQAEAQRAEIERLQREGRLPGVPAEAALELSRSAQP